MGGILIVDAGGTKTDWSLINQETNSPIRVSTKGISPIHETSEQIRSTIKEAKEHFDTHLISHIVYYGTGCASEEIKSDIFHILKEEWPETIIEIGSDIIGASKALFGDGSGVVCILGTGSNTCRVLEGKIVDQIPSLGYILGDEGSGAALGKRLINQIFKRQLSSDLFDKFQKSYNLSYGALIEKVYRSSMPSSFLASFSHFIYENRDHPDIKEMIEREFDDFFIKNIKPYNLTPQVSIGFVGSIGIMYKEFIQKTGEKYGFNNLKFIQSPISDLEKYFAR